MSEMGRWSSGVLECWALMHQLHHSITPVLQYFSLCYVAPGESILIRPSSLLATPASLLISRDNFRSSEFL
jgi:hypothetical protein